MLKRRDYQEFIMECDQLSLSTSCRLGGLQGCIFINSEILHLLYFLISSTRIYQIYKKYITFFLIEHGENVVLILIFIKDGFYSMCVLCHATVIGPQKKTDLTFGCFAEVQYLE